MKSVPASMIWEMCARGRWYLLFATLGAIAFPAMILMALDRDGALNPADSSMLLMHTIMAIVSMLFCGSSPLQAQGKISRLYTLPLPTSQLVTWRLLPAMVIIVVQMAVIAAVLNAMFHLDWPVWGPALAAAVIFAAVEAALWLTEESVAWLIVAIAVVGAVLGLWFRSRYGTFFAPPQYYWQNITPTEVITMLAFATASYWVAVQAVSRNRRGEPAFSLGIADRINRILESYTTFTNATTTPIRSQCRYEWQRKGWLMPAAVAVVVPGAVIGWFIGSRDPEELLRGFVVGGGGLWLIGFIGGVAFGNSGPSDSNFRIGSFLAARPISDRDLTHAILKTAAASVLLAWLCWAIPLLLAYLYVISSTTFDAHRVLRTLPWMYYPASLLGPWLVTGIVASLCLSGRPKLIVSTICAVPGLIIIVAILSDLLPSHELKELLKTSITVVVSIAGLVGTLYLFVVAYNRELVSKPTACALGVAWLASVAIIALLEFQRAGVIGILAISAALALVVLPLAGAPLAISVNRHR
jgi:hypothetical protein